MVSAFKEKRTVNNGNWWGDTGRYWRDNGVNRVDIGAMCRREWVEVCRPAVYLTVNREQVKNGHPSFLQIPVGFYDAGIIRYRNIQLKKNWTRARRRFKRVSIGVSGSSRICFLMGNQSRSALFSGFTANA